MRRRWWPNDYRQFLEFASYAEKALDEDSLDSPGRLFASLIKQNEHRITQGQEDRAHLRFPTTRIEAIVQWVTDTDPDRNAPGNPEEPPASMLVDRNIGFLPAAAVQCFFPQKRLPKDVREWDVAHGNTALRISAGNVADRDNPRIFRKTEVPHGRLARLLFAYVIGQAVKTSSSTIDMGTSLRNFMTRLGIAIDGRQGKHVTTAVEDLAGATFLLGVWGEDAVHSEYARVMDRVSFWIEPDERQRTFWSPEIVLSDRFYDQVQAHRVPVDMDHLALLMRSPRRMDVYTWLSYRTALIARRRSVRVSLQELQPVFAPDIAEFRKFKQSLQHDLKAVARVWPHFNVEIRGDALMLRWSESPVPRRPMIQGN
ncbi:MAG: replication protein RepA [Gammaproteobacteria bacterium]|nr:replication protein RepA [Gammaproteobacteria bacterium]